MKRIALPERPDWKRKADDPGFHFHTMHGEPYCDETSAYAFTLEQIERDIEAPATALHALRLDAPTALNETGSFQWLWLEDQIAAGVLPTGTDQFNAVHEAMAARLGALFPRSHDIRFASVAGVEEHFATVEYMAWIANEAGLTPHYVALDAIGVTDAGQFADAEARVIGTLFKLYPWEDMLRDDFAAAIPAARCRIIEPAWKALLSDKGLPPVLWRLDEGHPNLLPAFFAVET